MGLRHTLNAAKYRRTLNERETNAISKKLAKSFGQHNPRETIYETIGSLAENGIWPVDQTGGFASFHGPSCNFLFCDGSVRLMQQSINTQVYRLLGNRADGEPISSDSY